MIPKCKPWDSRIVTRYAHVKRDGHQLLLEHNAQGVITALTRKPTEIFEQLTHCDWLHRAAAGIPQGQAVAGELWYPDKPASYVKTAIAERDSALMFSAFAVPTADPLMDLYTVRALCESWGIDFIPWMPYDDAVLMIERCNFPPDVEGFVFKEAHLAGWYKWKPVQTIEGVITGYKEGNGKYLGMTGAVLVSVHSLDGRLIEIASVSGMDDETRLDISEHEDEYVGRVMEVSYQYVGSKGRLRHPRFKCWRPDRSGADCWTDQDPNLEEYWSTLVC